MSARISIITPSFNQARFIKENIESILAQRYPDVEHIIIDGGSTDGTLDILRSYPHLRWVSEPDNGQSDALNKGFRMATGEIVGWVNSDDTYCANIFSVVAAAFADPSLMVAYGDGYETDERGGISRPLVSRGVSIPGMVRYWRWEYEFVQPAFFFRRRVFDEVGYLDASLYYAMDYDLILRLLHRYSLKYIPQPLACLRLYETSKTGRAFQKLIPDYIWEMQRVSQRHWGTPFEARFYGYLGSFCGAVVFSIVKNLLFLRGSKSRAAITRFMASPGR